MRCVHQLLSILILVCLKTVAPAQGPPRLDLVVQTGHSDTLTCAALSTDGKYLVTGSDDDITILWEVASGKKLQAFQGHTRPVKSVAVSRDGKRVVTGSYDGTAIVWESASGKKLHTFQGHDKRKLGQEGGPPNVMSVALSDDGKYVVSAAPTAILWETAGGKILQTFEGRRSVALSADGKHVLTGSDDGTGNLKAAILWEAATGKKVHTFQGHTDHVKSVALSPDGKLVLAGSDKGTTIVWEAEGGKQLQVFQGAKGLFSVPQRDGIHVLTMSWNQLKDGRMTTTLFEALSGKQIQAFQQSGHGAALCGNGKYVVTADSDGNALMWDAANGKKLHTIQGHSPIVRSFLSGDGKHVLNVSWFKQSTRGPAAMLWEATGGKKLPIFGWDRIAPIFTIMALSHDGKYVLSGRPMGLWEVASGKQLQTFTQNVSSAALSHDGKHVVTRSSNGTAILWDVVGGKQLQTFPKDVGGVNRVTFSSDGKVVVLAGSKEVALWEAVSGKKLHTFQGYASLVALSGDGKKLLTAPWDDTATLWETAGGKKLHTFKGHTGRLTSAALSGDGKHVVTGSSDLTASLWDAATGKKLHTFQGHSETVESVAISADSKDVWTASLDGTTRLWDPATGQERCRLYALDGVQPPPFRSLPGKDWLVVTPDGFWDGSEGAGRFVAYRETGTLKLVDDEVTRKRFRRPGLLAQIWKGEK